MGNKIKMFVSDMDGTLLGLDFRISEKNAAAIRSLEHAGIEFVIATGRIYCDAYEICRQSQIYPDIISNNGACIFNSRQEQIYGRWLPTEGLDRIINFMEEHRICYAISTSRSYLIPENWEELLEKESESLKQRGSLVSPAQVTYMREEMLSQVGVEIVPDLNSYIADGNSCYMISVHTFDPEVIRTVREFISGFDNVTALLSTDHTVDIIGRNCSKAAAIKYLTQLRHMSRENVASIGDGMNDISMLRESAVAMSPANAANEVRAISEFITRSNADDAVADAIRYITANY